jgi:hypothetical protein
MSQSLEAPLQRHLAKVKLLHEEDALAGYGEVILRDISPTSTRQYAASFLGGKVSRLLRKRPGRPHSRAISDWRRPYKMAVWAHAPAYAVVSTPADSTADQ